MKKPFAITLDVGTSFGKTVPARGERFDRLMSTSFLPATISALPVKIFRVGCSMPKAATMKKPGAI